MAIEAGDVVWNITGQTKDLNQALNDSERMARETFARTTQIAGAAMTAIGASITGFQMLNIKAYEDSELASKKLDQVLRSTGQAAGMTREACDNLANSLAEVTAYEDDTIKSAEAVMLTFTKVGKEVFPQAIESAMDLSTFMGQDLQSSIVQIGKALNDPIQGVSALQRVGVSFTESQKEQIKVLVETGKTMDAQKMILKELGTEFGGQARGELETFAGQVKKIKQNFGELQEALGKPLVEDLKRLTAGMKDFNTEAAKWAEEHPRFSEGLALTGAALSVGGPVLVGLGSLVNTITLLRIRTLLAAGALGAGGAAAEGGVGLTAALLGLLPSASSLAPPIAALTLALGDFDDKSDESVFAVNKFKDALKEASPGVSSFADWYKKSGQAAKDMASDISGSTDLIGAALQTQMNAYYGLGDTVDVVYNNMTGTIVSNVTYATQEVQRLANEAIQDVNIASQYAAAAEARRTHVTGLGYLYNETQGLTWWGGGDWEFQNPAAFAGAGFGPGVADLIRRGAKPGGPGVETESPRALPAYREPKPLPAIRPLPSAEAPAVASYAQAGPSTINVNVTMPVKSLDVDVKSDLEQVSRDIGQRIQSELRRRGLR